MKDLWPLQIIELQPKKAGRPFGSVSINRLKLLSPEMVGNQYGKLKIISQEIQRNGKKQRAYCFTQCQICLSQSWKEYSSLIKSKAGCQICGNSPVWPPPPKWLQARCIMAKDRCTNINSKHYQDYGGRGIEFKFQSPIYMAIWIMENLGLEKELHIDRINN